MTAHQAPLSLGFSRQEYWSGWYKQGDGDTKKQKEMLGTKGTVTEMKAAL